MCHQRGASVGRMSRFGPLHAIRRTLVVGDPGRQHLALAREEVRYHDGDETPVVFPWSSIVSIELNLPATKFRFPALVSGVALSALALFIQDDPNIEPKNGTVTVTTRDGRFTWPLSSHNLGGYWQRSAEVAQRLVTKLIDDETSRALLDHPATLIESVTRAGRRGHRKGA